MIKLLKRESFHINVTAYESGGRAANTRDPSDPGGVCWPVERGTDLSGLHLPHHLGMGPGGGGEELQEAGEYQGGNSLDSLVSVVMTDPGRSKGGKAPPGGNQSGEVLETEVRDTAEDVIMQEVGGAMGGLPPDSSVSVVMTGPGRSKGEEASPVGGQSGELSEEESTDAAGNPLQAVEPPWTEVLGRNRRLQNGEPEVGAAAMSSLVGRMRDEGARPRGGFEPREGDWNCKSRGCEGYLNFRRRGHCRKCGRDKDGARPQNQEQHGREQRERSLSPGERFRSRAEERGEIPRRQPKVTAVMINLLVEGKDNVRLPEKDNFEVIKQAGLNIREVRGKFTKPGHLEVALSPGALSVSRALRENQKQVNDRITITSVRERGTNRAVLIRWQEVPFETADETIINYMQLFSKMESVGRSLRWEMIKEEEDSSPGGEMVGKWSGERTVRAVLKEDIGHIPTWHYVGGARLRLQVPGRRNCPRCLQSVGECKGGRIWGKCEEAKTPRGNWKEEQETFLSRGGWDEKKQKVMEGLEQKEAEAATAGEDEEAEGRREEERALQLEEVREGLVQQLSPDKTCGGLLLRDLPQGTGDKSREKQECLLMIMYASNLAPQEQDRLMTAEVKVKKGERVKKGTIDVTITLENADGLLRKVWHQLEKACAQEGVKRYQIEASSVLRGCSQIMSAKNGGV